MQCNNYQLIDSGQKPLSFPLREVYHYRDLLYFFTRKNFIIRYKQTVIGVGWALFQPFIQMVVFSIFFGKFARIPSEGIPYPIFVYAALLPWTFFANSLISCNNAVINHAGLITKVYFPRLIIPLSAVITQLLDYCIAMLLLFGIMLFYQYPMTINFIMLIPLTLLTIFTAIGLGSLIAAVAAVYRDFRHIVPFLVQVWLFATPVIYPASIVGAQYEIFLNLNPLAGIINGFRSAVTGQAFDWEALGLSCLVATVAFFIGIWYYQRVERRFADII